MTPRVYGGAFSCATKSIYDGAAMTAAIITPAFSHADHRLRRVVEATGLPWLVLHEHSDLPRVRSVLIEQALATPAERIILLDADTVPGLEALRALAESEEVTPERAVWGMYPLREGDRWSVSPVDAVAADRAIRQGESFPINTGGLGLCAIHRQSLERLGETLPTIPESTGLRWRPFCVPFVRGQDYYADDGSLCVRLHETGTELWCNPLLRAGHVVRQVVTALRG
jgi:hypothetical protein